MHVLDVSSFEDNPQVSLFQGDYASETFDISAAASTDTQPIQKILYDSRSAAEALSISLRSLDACVANGTLEFIRHGSKIMFLQTHLLKFAKTPHDSLTQ
jgi:hypothetical protein